MALLHNITLLEGVDQRTVVDSLYSDFPNQTFHLLSVELVLLESLEESPYLKSPFSEVAMFDV